MDVLIIYLISIYLISTYVHALIIGDNVAFPMLHLPFLYVSHCVVAQVTDIQEGLQCLVR